MKQPDFIFGGATLSGLAELMRILDDHPQMYIPQRKEHMFFHQGKILSHSPESCKTIFEDAVHTEYKKQIPPGRVLHGEQEYEPSRAHEGCPHAKIIFTLSDPVTRAFTQYQNAVANKKETAKSFEHAIESELAGLRTPDTTGKCWIYKNQYQTHIEHWLSFYPKEKLLILIHEEWSDETNRTAFHSLEQFLGLKKDSLVRGTYRHTPLTGREEERKKKIPSLSETTREQLEDIFAVDKGYISKLLGRPIDAWDFNPTQKWASGY